MVKIKVPATSANIGTGYDCYGIALKLYNKFWVTKSETLKFEGFNKEHSNENNLVYKAFKKTLEKLKINSYNVEIKFKGDIPLERGLGSSSTCIIAGVIAALELENIKYSNQDVLSYASILEPHFDNLVPALIGGLTLSFLDEDNFIIRKNKVRDNLKFIALIPDFSISTKHAREILPKHLSYSDAINNISRVALISSSLKKGNLLDLKYALKDRLHEPYRLKLIKDYKYIEEHLKKQNIDTYYISGSGPTIVVITNEDKELNIEGRKQINLKVCKKGTVVKRIK